MLGSFCTLGSFLGNEIGKVAAVYSNKRVGPRKWACLDRRLEEEEVEKIKSVETVKEDNCDQNPLEDHHIDFVPIAEESEEKDEVLLNAEFSGELSGFFTAEEAIFESNLYNPGQSTPSTSSSTITIPIAFQQRLSSIANFLVKPMATDQFQVMANTLEIVISRIRFMLDNGNGVRQALYFRLLRITQYLAWKFPTYGSLQQLLDEVLLIKSKNVIGQQTTDITLLGKRYVSPSCEDFEADWNSRFFFTYKKNFKPILNTKITSDQGWGCYLRVFQMMIAQCYSVSIFGREWRADVAGDPLERELIKELFIDSEKSVFSIHNFCRIGESLKKKPGDWFGPNTAGIVSKRLFAEIHGEDDSVTTDSFISMERRFLEPKKSTGVIRKINQKYKFAHRLKLCYFDDGCLDPDIVKEALNEENDQNIRYEVMIFLGKMFGAERHIAPESTEAVKQVFKCASFQGMACGDPATSAHYFIAGGDSYLYYLDPHVETRPALNGAEMDTSSWHSLRKPGNSNGKGTPCLFKLPYESLNSSCCFCFLVRSEDDLAQLCVELEMYDALHEAFEVKKGANGFFDSLSSELGLGKDWSVDDEDADMVLL